MIFQKSFYFVRHGETDWNRIGVYQGPNDIPLNHKGREQAHRLGEELASYNFKEIFTSPLNRAYETANIINQYQMNSKEIIKRNGLQESRSPQSAKRVLELTGITSFPSFKQLRERGQTPKMFFETVEKTLDSILSTTNEPPLIVSHGGVCTALCRCLNLPYLVAKNCCFLLFEYSEGRYQLQHFHP